MTRGLASPEAAFFERA